jgi:hypothetical protein
MDGLNIRIEKRRGFQPPWYTVAIYSCSCGNVTTLRRSWKGSTPPGAVACLCGKHLPFV